MTNKKFTQEDIEQYQAMKDYSDLNSDMPDGAFFAMAEENDNWTTDDWVWYAEEGWKIQQLLDKREK
jgi:hypothetical protein